METVAMLTDIDAFIQAEMAQQHLPGLSLAVVQRGVVTRARLLHFLGSGFRESTMLEILKRLSSSCGPLICMSLSPEHLCS
jgi:hypothetical protein